MEPNIGAKDAAVRGVLALVLAAVTGALVFGVGGAAASVAGLVAAVLALYTVSTALNRVSWTYSVLGISTLEGRTSRPHLPWRHRAH